MPTECAKYLEQGKEAMIMSEKVPSLSIASYAFGVASVKMLIKAYLFQTSKALGLTADEENIALITEDIIAGYGDMKITDIMLALAMMRQGKIRYKDGDAAKQYGCLSSEVICDCLYRYRFDVRNPIIERSEQERKMREKEQDVDTPYSEKVKILAKACLKTGETWLLDLAEEWLQPHDKQSILRAMEELNALRLLRTVAQEYVNNVNNGGDPKTCMTRLCNGLKYLDNNYPINNEQQ